MCIHLPPLRKGSNADGSLVGGVGKTVGDTTTGLTNTVSDTTKGAGDTVKGATSQGGETTEKKQSAENPLGL